MDHTFFFLRRALPPRRRSAKIWTPRHCRAGLESSDGFPFLSVAVREYKGVVGRSASWRADIVALRSGGCANVVKLTRHGDYPDRRCRVTGFSGVFSVV